ncbi:MAG: hypothetical protein LQ346_008937 [Caloplaca aetnensis]|nr:MAG: hypothetical protein LQ346_008937 [Caloplaca aetnensis]
MASVKYSDGLLQVGGFWAAILAGLLVIGLIAYMFSHWGWWKLRRQEARRRPLVRTWHGWVEPSVPSEKRARNRLRKPPPRMVPRTARTDYSWVFWDPTGAKQKRFKQEREEAWLRYLPRWMRWSRRSSTDATTVPNPDIEAAMSSAGPGSDEISATGHLGTLSLLGRQWREDWRRSDRWTHSSKTCVETSDHVAEGLSAGISTAAEDISDHNTSTIRLRRTSRPYKSTWNANSEDIERATQNQLLAPTAAFNLANLFRSPAQTLEGSTQRGTSPSACEQGRAGYTKSQHAPITDLLNDRHPSETRSIASEQSTYRLPRKQSRRGLAQTLYTSQHAIPTTSYSFPGRITSIGTCGAENTRPLQLASASVAEGRDDQSIADHHQSIVDDRIVDQDPHRLPSLNVRKMRKGKGAWSSTGGSVAEAEKMSIISVPSVLFSRGDVEYGRRGGGEDLDGLDG